MLTARKEAGPNPPPSLREWDGVQAKLAEVIDLLQSLCAISAHADSPPQPIPRPITAADRLDENRKETNRDGLLSQLLGERYDPDQ